MCSAKNERCFVVDLDNCKQVEKHFQDRNESVKSDRRRHQSKFANVSRRTRAHLFAVAKFHVTLDDTTVIHHGWRSLISKTETCTFLNFFSLSFCLWFRVTSRAHQRPGLRASLRVARPNPYYRPRPPHESRQPTAYATPSCRSSASSTRPTATLRKFARVRVTTPLQFRKKTPFPNSTINYHSTLFLSVFCLQNSPTHSKQNLRSPYCKQNLLPDVNKLSKRVQTSTS